jgi:hypothetical protein
MAGHQIDSFDNVQVTPGAEAQSDAILRGARPASHHGSMELGDAAHGTREQPVVRTWNTPAAIARHAEMTPEERVREAVELSQVALRFARPGAESMDRRAFEPVEVLRRLDAAGVAYVVVGAFAVAAHGVVRATRDLDLIVERSWDNATRLVTALRGMGAEPLSRTGTEGLEPETLVRQGDRRFMTRHGEVHVVHEVDGVPEYEQLASPLVLSLDQVEVPVCGLADLRAIKEATGRPKNRVDLRELAAIERLAAQPPGG